jgi:hypothetical protein
MEGLLWGIAGYVFYRISGGKDDKWIAGAFVSGAIYFILPPISRKVCERRKQFEI